MKNGKFHERLKRVMQIGNLTVADLARLFDRSHATVNGWIKLKVSNPSGGPVDVNEIHGILGELESRAKNRRGLPVPRLTPNERIGYVAKLRRELTR